jgi:hypothetical protein
MRFTVGAAALVSGYLLASGAPAFSQDPSVLLTPQQTRAYHACMTAAWVQDFCTSHAWGIFATFDRTKAECIAADRGNIFPLEGRRYFENTEGYCWSEAHRVR